MSDRLVELAEIELPDFGTPTVEPAISADEYAARLSQVRERADARGLEFLLVYGDREHGANLTFLTGYDPRFEESLLVVGASGGVPTLLVGNEGWAYAGLSPAKVERRLYQRFSLMGQDRSRSDPLEAILRDAGLRPGSRVGLVDWKYEVGPDGRVDERWLNAPSYLAEAVRGVTGQLPVSATDLLMNPVDGMRAINTVDQLACFEFAATHASSALRRLLLGLRPGLSELSAMENARLNGLPLCCHPMLSAGPRAAVGLCSPSSRRMALGEPLTCALGVWGALSARAGFLVHDKGELPPGIGDYVERLIVPYFAAIAQWYQRVGLGVTGGEMHETIQSRLGDPFFGVGLNPGHLIHLDEWLHSPIYADSKAELRSGMALQVDVIPATGGPYFTTNIEDGIALADAELRAAFARGWPEAWSRIQARRTFLREKLGIELKPEVLPFSNLAAHLTPYLLEPGRAMRVVG